MLMARYGNNYGVKKKARDYETIALYMLGVKPADVNMARLRWFCRSPRPVEFKESESLAFRELVREVQDLLKHGATPEHVGAYMKAVGKHCIIVDMDNDLVYIDKVNTNENRNVPPLYARVHNGHIYTMTEQMEKSLRHKFVVGQTLDDHHIAGWIESCSREREKDRDVPLETQLAEVEKDLEGCLDEQPWPPSEAWDWGRIWPLYAVWEGIREKLEKRGEYVFVDLAPGELATDVVARLISEAGKLPYPFGPNIRFNSDGKTVKSLRLAGKLYIFVDPEQEGITHEVLQTMFQRAELQYTGGGFLPFVGKLFKQLYQMDFPKGYLNPRMDTMLRHRKVKDRVMRGWANGWGPEKLQEAVQAGRVRRIQREDGFVAAGMDLNKAYLASLWAPREASSFLLPDYTEVDRPFKWGEEIVPGLYYVETDNQLPMSGPNWYSHNMVRYAQRRGINMHIRRIMPIRGEVPLEMVRRLFARVIDTCAGLCDDRGKPIYRKVLHNFTGNLARAMEKKSKIYMASDEAEMNYMWGKIVTADKADKSNLILPHPISVRYPDGTRAEYCFYGHETTKFLAEHNIPMYIQMKDENNIRWFEMVEAMGGKLVLAKVDYALTDGLGEVPQPPPPEVPEWCSEEVRREVLGWGGYKVEVAPKTAAGNTFEDACQRNRFVKGELKEAAKGEKWEMNEHIVDSSQCEEILASLRQHKGMVLLGPGGAGKTFVTKYIRSQFPAGSVYFVAPTHKAAGELPDGATLDSFVGRNKHTGELKPSFLAKVRQNLRLLVVDEISMTNTKHWQCLGLLKQLVPELMFLLMGDFKQCQPVGDTPVSFEYHPIVGRLANYNRVDIGGRNELNHRYGLDVAGLRDHVYRHPDQPFPRTTETQTYLYKKFLCKFPRHEIWLPTEVARRASAIRLHVTFLRDTTLSNINRHVMERLAPPDCLVILAPEYMSSAIDTKMFVGMRLIGRRTVYKSDKANARSWFLPKCPKALKGTFGPQLEAKLVMNNESFEVTELDPTAEQFTAVSMRRRWDEAGNELAPVEHRMTFPFELFHHLFQLRYAVTVYQAQGMTIREKYCIWDTDRMDKHMKYVAVTRATRLTDLYVAETPAEWRDREVLEDQVIERKLKWCFQNDDENGRVWLPSYIRPTVKDIRAMQVRQMGVCAHCGVNMRILTKLGREDADQASLDRLEDLNNEPHHLRNLVLGCLGCQRKHQKKMPKLGTFPCALSSCKYVRCACIQRRDVAVLVTHYPHHYCKNEWRP